MVQPDAAEFLLEFTILETGFVLARLLLWGVLQEGDMFRAQFGAGLCGRVVVLAEDFTGCCLGQDLLHTIYLQSI